MAHGSGGAATSELIRSVFASAFHNEYLDRMEDSAVVPVTDQTGGKGTEDAGDISIAMTTDSYVVTPYFFPGGDIGRLAVCGTVNDLLMSGADPVYLTCGFILEEGFPVDDLKQITDSMAATAKEAGVKIVTGDTKVVEKRGEESGIFINTAGVGLFRKRILRPDRQDQDIPEHDNSDKYPSVTRCTGGDVIIITGNLGDHHAAILSKRMGIRNGILSDTAPLTEAILRIKDRGIDIHAMRDITRGGLATILNEFAGESNHSILIEEETIPVSPETRDFCGLLGLDPLYMGNEGKAVIVVSEENSAETLEILHGSRYTEDAVIVGHVTGEGSDPHVTVKTKVGGLRHIGPLIGEGLPRVC